MSPLCPRGTTQQLTAIKMRRIWWWWWGGKRSQHAHKLLKVWKSIHHNRQSFPSSSLPPTRCPIHWQRFSLYNTGYTILWLLIRKSGEQIDSVLYSVYTVQYSVQSRDIRHVGNMDIAIWAQWHGNWDTFSIADNVIQTLYTVIETSYIKETLW